MEQELISKKELLELTGISYGQLYRWKRKNLIPEEWFIRKSTFTGQETFFRKQQILDRIEKIKQLKDDLSLDELADLLAASDTTGNTPSGVPDTNLTASKDELVKRNIVSEMSLKLYGEEAGDITVFSYPDLLGVYLLDTLLKTGEVSLNEGRMMVQTFSEHAGEAVAKPYHLIVTRKMGVSSVLLAASPGDVRFDRGVKVAARLDVARCMAELNGIWNETGDAYAK